MFQISSWIDQWHALYLTCQISVTAACNTWEQMSLVFLEHMQQISTLKSAHGCLLFFFFSIFFLSFSNLAMPKGLRANLNVADIGSVVPYPEHLQGNFSKKDNLSLWCDSLSICSPRELKRWERFVCLLEVG